jgi:hypothetical protein
MRIAEDAMLSYNQWVAALSVTLQEYSVTACTACSVALLETRNRSFDNFTIIVQIRVSNQN